MTLESFTELWYTTTFPTVLCEIYAHPLHRRAPVRLHYETLPEPFKTFARDSEHIGKTGDTVQATPSTCYHCEMNIINQGSCDPL